MITILLLQSCRGQDRISRSRVSFSEEHDGEENQLHEFRCLIENIKSAWASSTSAAEFYRRGPRPMSQNQKGSHASGCSSERAPRQKQ